MSLLVRNGRVVTADRDEILDLYVEKETIAAVGRNLPHRADHVIDASRRLVIPGGVDPHTHLDAPVGGTASSDDFASGTRAAALGGTTCIIDFATQERGVSLAATLDRWLAKARPAVVDYAFHMIVVDLPPGETRQLDRMADAGVTSFKLFMAYPGVLMSDEATITRVMERARDLGAVVCMHAEDGTAIEDNIRRALAAGQTAPRYHALTRPPATEASATAHALRMAEKTGVTTYIVHVTCAEALAELNAAAERGVRAFGETCPHYLLLTDAELDRPAMEGAKYVLTPPLRGASHHEPLWEALRTNRLQVVSTDHCPFFFREQKLADARDFTHIPNGGPGIEHRLELTWHEGVRRRGIPVKRWVDMISTAPARIFGLYPKKGEIAVGSDADIVLWDPEVTRTISAASHRMRVDYSLYEGFTVTGGADIVIARGEVIVRNGVWTGRKGRGKFLRRAAGETGR